MCVCCQQLKAEISGKDRQIEAKNRQIEGLSQELRLALQMVEMMRHRMFGRSSEQNHPDQGTFEQILSECDQLNGAVPLSPVETEKIE